MKNAPLWNKIKAFKLDIEGDTFNFSKRLARDNNWDTKFTLKVIEEYKKFIYLSCISNKPITPSDYVDQAWHLHLTYTVSYWKDFCSNTINRDIHHNPTKGGKHERDKFSNSYNLTFDLYNSEFGYAPPSDIWFDNKTRFRDINFKRINLNNYWLIKRPKKKILELFNILFIVGLIPILFLNVKGDDFPYGIFILVIIIIIIIKYFRNNNGNSGCDVGCTFDDSGCSSDGCSGCGGCD